jgi:hypothetical protein
MWSCGQKMLLMNGRKVFHGYDIDKSIENLFEDEYFVKDLIDMLSSFILQVAKIDGNLYPPTRYMFHFIKFIFWFCFCKEVYVLGFRFILQHSSFYYYYCVFILCIYSICFGLLYWIYFMCFLVWFFYNI